MYYKAANNDFEGGEKAYLANIQAPGPSNSTRARFQLTFWPCWREKDRACIIGDVGGAHVPAQTIITSIIFLIRLTFVSYPSHHHQHLDPLVFIQYNLRITSSYTHGTS